MRNRWFLIHFAIPWLWSGITWANLVHLNDTDILIHGPGVTADNIECLPARPSRIPTTVDGCRSTLNLIRGLPNYKRIQDFIEYRLPREPGPPPYCLLICAWRTNTNTRSVSLGTVGYRHASFSASLGVGRCEPFSTSANPHRSSGKSHGTLGRGWKC